MNLAHEQVFQVLATIPDPEMPISIVDLGLVEAVRVQSQACNETSRTGLHIEIDLVPTFIGCPAQDMIAGDVRAKVGAIANVDEVKVNWIFDPPWTVDRINDAGRDSLREHGVTVPPAGSGDRLHVPAHQAPQTITLRTSAVPCPFCGSKSTYLDSPFGPTRCRTIYYCEGCRNSFEHLKKLEPRMNAGMNTDKHG